MSKSCPPFSFCPVCIVHLGVPLTVAVTQVLRMRYDRLRDVSSRIQNHMGDLATQGERIQSLLSWRDPRYVSKRSSIFATAPEKQKRTGNLIG